MHKNCQYYLFSSGLLLYQENFITEINIIDNIIEAKQTSFLYLFLVLFQQNNANIT
jgi:hypothetical protein